MNWQWLRDAFTENWGVKLVSLLIACILWTWVMSGEQSEEHFKIPLRLANTPEEVVVLSQVPEYISVRLVGPRPLLSTARSATLNYTLDLTGMQPGTSTYEILSARMGIPPGLEVVAKSPQELTLQADNKVTKSLTIKPIYKGVPAEGFEVAEVLVNPAEVEIEGAERHLKALREIATEVVDITGLEGNLSRSVNIAPPDPTLKRTGDDEITIEVVIKEMVGERQFLQVPVKVPKGFVAKPSTVEIRLGGKLATLGRLRAEDIPVSVYFDSAARARGPAKVMVATPEGLKLIEIMPQEVMVIKNGHTEKR